MNYKNNRSNIRSFKTPKGLARPSKGPQPSSKSATLDDKKFQIPKDWRSVAGQHAVQELLKVRPKSVELAWLVQGYERMSDLEDLVNLLKRHRIKIEEKPRANLDKWSSSHQGAILFSSERPEIDWDQLKESDSAILVLLDGIEDPHNLGAIVRTSWLMGAKGILIPQDRSVGLTASAHKVACGGVEHVPVEEHTNFTNVLNDLKEMGFWAFGLSHLGKQDLYRQKLPQKIVWCIGAEDKGLRTATERACDELVLIPQASAAASYNASVATAIALSETFRQNLSK